MFIEYRVGLLRCCLCWAFQRLYWAMMCYIVHYCEARSQNQQHFWTKIIASSGRLLRLVTNCQSNFCETCSLCIPCLFAISGKPHPESRSYPVVCSGLSVVGNSKLTFSNRFAWHLNRVLRNSNRLCRFVFPSYPLLENKSRFFGISTALISASQMINNDIVLRRLRHSFITVAYR